MCTNKVMKKWGEKTRNKDRNCYRSKKNKIKRKTPQRFINNLNANRNT